MEQEQQYYLRAEPSEEGRKFLRRHQEHLQSLFHDLRLSPRLTKADDLHWTALFLGSPRRWSRALRVAGYRAKNVSADDLVRLAWTARERLRAETAAHRPEGLLGYPTAYDVFFPGKTNAVFVLRLSHMESVIAILLRAVQETLRDWEGTGKIPAGIAANLFAHAAFPLARERSGGKPHVTLARGRVSRPRQRDVLRSLRAAPLAARDPIAFTRADIRVVSSSAIIDPHA